MAEDLPFDVLMQFLQGSGILDYHPPMAVHADVDILTFGPYSSSGSWLFRTSMGFETANAALRDLFAMAYGSLLYVGSGSGQPARLVLVRSDVVGIGLTRMIGMLPSWFPWAPYILYDNVDPVEARSAAVAAFSQAHFTEPTIKRIKNKDPQFQLTASTPVADQLADLWMADKIPGGLLVTAGQRIGACAHAGGGQAFGSEVRIVDTVDPAPQTFYNPAYFLALWEEMGWLKGPALLPASPLIRVSGPPSGNGVIHPISGGGSHFIADAISSANAGDTILIVDAATYTDELVIDKPVNVMSSSQLLATVSNALDFPKLDGEKAGLNAHRPVKFSDFNSGIAFVGGFSIENGLAPTDRYDGGGILVETNRVVISNCVVEGCEARGSGFFGEGFGGGIAIYHCSPAILGCLVKSNRAHGRGNGIGVFGYGWPTIVKTHVKANSPSMAGLLGRHDGGGIAVEICVPQFENVALLATAINAQGADLSSAFSKVDLLIAADSYVRICGCEIAANVAIDDGGGVYVSCASNVIFRSTKVLNNMAYANGGGIRATFASSLVLRDCHVQNNHSQADLQIHDLDGVEKKAGGGGIATRNARLVDLVRTHVTNNTANGWSGGGISFITSDEGTPPVWGLAGVGSVWPAWFDWNDFLWDKDIYNYDHGLLRIDASSQITGNAATKFALQLKDHGKGGGLYALRWSDPRQSGHTPPAKYNNNGKMEAWWFSIEIAKDSTIVSNTASYSDSRGSTARIYIENQVKSEFIFDDDLTPHYYYTS